jgi:outer membrane receptor protein involved in Fe transport
LRTHLPPRFATFALFLIILALSTAGYRPGRAQEITPPDSLTPATETRDSVLAPARPGLVNAFVQNRDSGATALQASFPWINLRSTGDVVGLAPGAYLRDPSSAGQYLQLNFRGIDWRGIAVTADGRLLNDPASGIYNPYHFATDFVDRIEIIPGPRSFLYGLNATGGVVNLLTKHYDNNQPRSTINYSEGAHKYGYFDGSISQNVTDRMNVLIGLQRQTTDGRFANSAHDAWNSRARIRYRISERFSVILAHQLTSTKTQLNGGLLPDPDNLANAFFPISTAVTNEDSYEKLNRNDVDLSLTGFFLDDSTSPTRLSLYYSNNFREYRDENAGTVPNAIYLQSDHTSSWMGGLLTQTLEGDVHRFQIRSNLEIRQIEGSPNLGRRRNVIGSVDASGELTVGGLVTVAAYGRYDRYLNKDYLGFGSDAKIALIPGLSLFGGGSFSWRLPTYQELYWVDSTVSRPAGIQEEEHRYVELGLQAGGGEGGMIRAAYFNRRVINPILLLPFGNFIFPGITFANGDEVINQGIDFRFHLRIWHLFLEGSGIYLTRNSDSPVIAEYPEFSVSGGVYFWEKLIEDHLHLKAGFSARYQTGQTGTAFNPEVLAYVQNPDEPIKGGAAIDLVVIGRIGDAYVHFIWENLTESEYFATPYYPVRDRAIRFGLSWQFLD